MCFLSFSLPLECKFQKGRSQICFVLFYCQGLTQCPAHALNKYLVCEWGSGLPTLDLGGYFLWPHQFLLPGWSLCIHLLPTTNLSSVSSKSCWRYLSSYLWFLLSTLCSIFWPSWPQRHHRTLSSPLQNPDNTAPAVFLESIHLVALSKKEMRLTWQEMRSVWQLVVKHWTMWDLIVRVNNVRHAQQCNRNIK